MSETARKRFQRTARMRGADAAWVDIEAEMERLKEENDCLCRSTHCAYCGDEFPLDTVTPTLISEHIRTCEKHPMRKVEEERADLQRKVDAAEKYIAEKKENLEREVNDGTYSDQLALLVHLEKAMKEA